MKKIFIIYSIWYILISLLMEFTIVPIIVSKIYGALLILNTGFVFAAPLFVMITPGLLRSNRHDSKYLNYCIYAGTLRIIFWSAAVFGLRDHMTLLFLNCFAMSVYALMENGFKRISNEYFKY